MTRNPTVTEIQSVLDALYDPRRAEDWDAVGLVAGDPEAPVDTVLFAVDPVQAVIDEAIAVGADLLVTHHPLLLRPTSSVAATAPKGRAVHSLISHQVALLTAHTNADFPPGGVSAAMADAFGLEHAEPIVAREPSPTGEPSAAAEPTATANTGTPAAPAAPAAGAGRIGRLPEPMTLDAFTHLVVDALPATDSVARVAGDPDRQVATVALCGGSGDFLLDQVRVTDADVYVTSDLRHHPASELLEHGDAAPALIDVPHWAAEWTWLPHAERLLAAAMAEREATVETRVSRIVTDPWTRHLSMANRDPRSTS